MLETLFGPIILVALSALGCYASSLDSFEGRMNLFPSGDINFSPCQASVKTTYKIENMVKMGGQTKVIMRCLDQCLLRKYFCRSVIVLETSDSDELQCIKFADDTSKIRWTEGEEKTSNLIAAYTLRQELGKQFIEESSKELYLAISTDDDDRTTGVITGYFGSKIDNPAAWKFAEDILTVCKKIVLAQPPKTVNFAKWLDQKDDSERQLSDYRTIYKRIATNVNTQTDSETLDEKIFAFLDVFSRSVSPGIITIYDSLAKKLFIEGPNLHILLVSSGSGDYYMLQDSSNISDKSILTHDTKPFLTTTDGTRKLKDSSLAIFQEAIGRFGHNVGSDTHNFNIAFFQRNKELKSLVMFSRAIRAILYPASRNFPVGDWHTHVFLRDLVNAVLFLYRRNQRYSITQSNLFLNSQRGNFELTDINTIG